MKYCFPIHLDGGNRGCEAIAKGTALILGESKDRLIGLCTDVALDSRLGVGEYVTLVSARKSKLLFRIRFKLYRLFVRDAEKRKCYLYRYRYEGFLNGMDCHDLMLSTGGDMLCYENNQVNYTVDYVHAKGRKSVLWGCSVGEDDLTPEKLRSLKHFSLIYARETLTRDVLAGHGVKNVVVYPDPAFVLQPEVCELPSCFNDEEVVGLNLSNYVMGGFSLNSEFAQEVKSLIDHILDKTCYRILLIPHVLWESQDDRIVCNALTKLYSNPRISILDSENSNYCQIRFAISHCRFFIGARTHSVISAYSTGVPSIAIGYSIKARGLVKDLGLPEWTLVDSKHFSKGQLVGSFKELCRQEDAVRNQLNREMENYKNKLSEIKKELRNL